MLILAVGWTVPGYSQEASPGSIRGTVISEGTRQPIGGATVVLLGGAGQGALTDSNGTYQLDGIPPGKHRVLVIAGGQRQESEVTVSAGQATILDLRLTSSDIPGEVVVVTGSRAPEKLLDAPVSADVVGEREMQQIGGTSYMSALAAASGFNYTEAGMFDQRVSARGFNAMATDRLLWLIDGRAAHNFSGTNPGNFAPVIDLDIKSMEAIVGPASALFGPNAQTGVLNIRTKSPWDESGASIKLRGGSQSLLDGSLRVAGVVKEQFGWKLLAQLMRADEIEPSRDSMPHYYGTTFFEGDLVEDYDSMLLKLEGTLYYRHGDWLAKAGYGTTQLDVITQLETSRLHYGPASWSWQFAELNHPAWHAHFSRSHVSLSAYTLSTLAALAQASATAGGVTPTEEQIAAIRDMLRADLAGQNMEAELQHRLQFRGLTAVLGAQWRMSQTGESFAFANPEGGDIQLMEIGGYGQVDYRFLHNKLRAVGALRYDSHSDFAAQLSPKAGIVYSPVPNQNIRLTYNHAFRSPKMSDLYYAFQGYVLGNLNGFTIRDVDNNVLAEIDPVKPENTDSIEIGYKGRIAEGVLAELSVHNTWYRNFISALIPLSNPFSPTDPTYGYKPDGTITAADTPFQGLLVTALNFGQAQTRGVDAGLSIYPNQHISVLVNGSWLSRVSFENSNAFVTQELLLNTPGLQLSGSVAVENLGLDNYFVRLGWRYRSSFPFESGYWSATKFLPDGEMPARFVADLGAGYTFPAYGVSIQANVMNALGDTSLDVLGAPLPRRLAFIELRYSYAGLGDL